MKYLLIFSLFLTFACKRLKPQPKEEIVFVPFLSTSSLYLRDNSGSLFEALQWYTYDFMGGHIIWSNLDVYSLTTGKNDYLFQIEDFYDPTKPAGLSNPKNFALFSINIKTRTGIENIVIDAYACGAAQADPAGYAACQADPDQNQFTYLNLDTLKSWKMTTVEAKGLTNWHLAFKDFDLMVNNGINGPGRNLVGLAYRNQNFFQLFDDGEIVPLLENIKQAKINNSGKDHFDRVDTTNIQYYLPKGHDRVIHESDWYQENASGEKEALNNTWIIKSSEGNSYFKFNVSNIENNNDESKISFSFNYQGPQSFEFSQSETTYELPAISNNQASETCIDLDTGDFGCENNLWDIKLETKTDGKWYIWTKNGAIPLADQDIALSTNSAL